MLISTIPTVDSSLTLGKPQLKPNQTDLFPLLKNFSEPLTRSHAVTILE